MPRRTIPVTAFTICDAEPGSGIDAVRDRPEADWLPANVPGGVHEALLAADEALLAGKRKVLRIGNYGPAPSAPVTQEEDHSLAVQAIGASRDRA